MILINAWHAVIGHMSLGCFKVKYLTPSYEKEDTTIEECVQHCKDKEYAYAGFDHSRQCYCVANLHTCELSPRKCRKRANKKCLPRNMIEVFRTSKNWIVFFLRESLILRLAIRSESFRFYERFEPWCHFISRLSIIVQVNVVLNGTVLDSD